MHQYVKECDTAFHAGVVVNPIWKGLRKNAAGEHVNPNFYTIGIEHEGTPAEEWTDAMYASSAALLQWNFQPLPSFENVDARQRDHASRDPR